MNWKILFACSFGLFYSLSGYGNQPDSAWLFSYATDINTNKNGLHFAWSIDRKEWNPIGPEHAFLRCDYGNWGSEKKMFDPILFRGADSLWHCLWSLNSSDGVFAHAASENLINWKRQSYPVVTEHGNCLLPEIAYLKTGTEYTITWLSTADGDTSAYSTTTSDFRKYTQAKKIPLRSRLGTREAIWITGSAEAGTVHKVAWCVIDDLIKAQQIAAYKHQLYSENSGSDTCLFKSVNEIDISITPDNSGRKKISNTLLGVFFEDINYAADGGLYAELIQNRDFEYALSDKGGNDETWNSKKAWRLGGKSASFVIDTVAPVHPNNKHYAVLKINKVGAGLINEGFDGIAVVAGEIYDFSVFARSEDAKYGTLKVRLVGRNGEIYGESTTDEISAEWNKYDAVLIAKVSADDAYLEVIPQMTATVDLDMISLFPRKTFKGHRNGMRSDLAQAIADLNPRFVRFPGGCVVHGDGIENIYRWKNTIGPLEARKSQRNLWGYHQSAGLGFYEYFRFCEDLGAEPIPVVAAGVPCQNSSTGGAGQQGGIPMGEMDDYIQDILDLIEYANGDTNTVWGKLRAVAGHPGPFGLKYIGIGNEDLISDIFEERFTLIYKTIKEKHPEITVIGTVGPFSEGTDYDEGWKIAGELNLPIVDEHYYQAPGWFVNNQDFYDKYDRSKSKVYLGEYASWGNTLYNALAEALFLCSVERNADVVVMSSYAPLLAREGNTQWHTDLIYFNNTGVKPSVNYYVQQLYGQNAGEIYIPVDIILSDSRADIKKRIGVSVVRDTKNHEIIVKLVNILPVAAKATIDLEGLNITGSEAEAIVLKGNPGEKNVIPEKYQLQVSKTLKVGLPPYSFTVFRIKTEGD